MGGFKVATVISQGLSDPNADRIVFWDDSEGEQAWLNPNKSLAISGTNLNVVAEFHITLVACTAAAF